MRCHWYHARAAGACAAQQSAQQRHLRPCIEDADHVGPQRSKDHEAIGRNCRSGKLVARGEPDRRAEAVADGGRRGARPIQRHAREGVVIGVEEADALRVGWCSFLNVAETVWEPRPIATAIHSWSNSQLQASAEQGCA